MHIVSDNELFCAPHQKDFVVFTILCGWQQVPNAESALRPFTLDREKVGVRSDNRTQDILLLRTRWIATIVDWTDWTDWKDSTGCSHLAKMATKQDLWRGSKMSFKHVSTACSLQRGSSSRWPWWNFQKSKAYQLPRKIHIYFSDTGGGHRASALALEAITLSDFALELEVFWCCMGILSDARLLLRSNMAARPWALKYRMYRMYRLSESTANVRNVPYMFHVCSTCVPRKQP